MRKIIMAIIAFTAVMAFSGCNEEKSAAKKLVRTFLKENLADQDYKIMSFSQLDSTMLISDSVFLQMKAKAASDVHFKKGFSLSDGAKPKKLMFIRVKYRTEKDTVIHTFYFDEAFTQVLSFKEG